jgi:hypothetical protein
MGYRIAWRHPDSDEITVGSYVFPSLEVASDVALAMDVTWPEIKHWPIHAEVAPDTVADAIKPEMIGRDLVERNRG